MTTVPRPSTCVGRKIEIRGVVQGVGFRRWIYRLAAAQGVAAAIARRVGV